MEQNKFKRYDSPEQYAEALSQLGEFTFRFVTDQNIHYTVGFYKDTIFMDDGANHYDHAFNVYRIYYGLYHPKTAQALLKKLNMMHLGIMLMKV